MHTDDFGWHSSYVLLRDRKNSVGIFTIAFTVETYETWSGVIVLVGLIED